MYTYILPQRAPNLSKIKKEPGLKDAGESSNTNETPSFRFCVRTTSFYRLEESLKFAEADDMWTCFLGGLNNFQTGPAFGSAYLVAFLVESLESRYKTSSASQRINFLEIQAMYDVSRKLKKVFQFLQKLKKNNSKFEDQTSLMAIFEQCLIHAKTDAVLPGPVTQMQAIFTPDGDNLKLIGELKKETSRRCGWLELDAGTIKVVEVESVLPSSLVSKFDPPPSCSDVYAAILREKALPAYGSTRKERDSETMTARLNRLCFEFLPSVADCTPVARCGDTFMHLVGPPMIKNHFFMIVMTKTTDGMAVAKFDSYEGCSKNVRVSESHQKNRCTDLDLFGFIQLFLAINRNIIFAEKSDAECHTILENLTIYTPSPAYNQPDNSNACWLFSIAVAEQVFAQLPGLAPLPTQSQAHAFFNKIIASVANILKEAKTLSPWIQKLKNENWDHCQTQNPGEAIQAGEKLLSQLQFKSAEDIFVGHAWQVQDICENHNYLANLAYAPSKINMRSSSLSKETSTQGTRRLGAVSFLAPPRQVDRARNLEKWIEQSSEGPESVGNKLQHCLSVENLWKVNGMTNHEARLQKLEAIICCLESVKTPEAMNKLVAEFLEDPQKFVTTGKGTVVARTEQNWQDYGEGSGGGDLALCVNTTNNKSKLWNPAQAIILYAAETRAYLPGGVRVAKSGGDKDKSQAVNTGRDKDFHFSYKGDSKNRVDCFNGIIPGCMWPIDTWMIVGSQNLKRATVGGQASAVGCATSVVVSDWRSPEKGKKVGGILETLTENAKRGRPKRNTLDFQTIQKQATKWLGSKFVDETNTVNCLDIPGNGDCLTQACCLNILTSADPMLATKFYRAMFPSRLHFTSLHTYVMQDSLNGCTRFWFARWLCQKHGIHNVLSKCCSQVVLWAEGSGENIHPKMLISDFLNLIASTSAMAEKRHAHWFCVTLITFFVEFLSFVLEIPVALLILREDGKQLTIHPDGTLCKTRKDLQESFFLVVKHENGDSLVASHYRPVLLDFQNTNGGFFTSCGLLPHDSLPAFLKHLLSDSCDPISLTYKNKSKKLKTGELNEFAAVSVAFYDNQPGEHAMVLPLYHEDRFSTKLLFWRVSLISEEHNKFVHDDVESDFSATLAMTLLRAPLYALNLLAPYSLCSEKILKDSGNCMEMFQACPATPGQCLLFARILRAMAKLLFTLSQSVTFFEHQTDTLLPRKVLAQKMKEIKKDCGLTKFTGMSNETNDTKVFMTFCHNCEMTSTVCDPNFAGIPSQLYWALLSAIVQRPIIILTDVVTTWDEHKKPPPLDSDLRGHKYHAVSFFDDDGEVCMETVKAKASLALPAYLRALKDPCGVNTFAQATHTAAILAILNIDQDGQPCGNAQDMLGTWNFGHYARNCADITIVPIIPIILSSSSLVTSGYMPVMSWQNLELKSPKYLKTTEDVSLHGLSLVDCVSICRQSFQSRNSLLQSQTLIPDLFLSMGWTGYVPQFDTTNPHQDTEFLARDKIILRKLTNLAKNTRAASENEIQAWLGFGNKELSKIEYSSKKLAGNLLHQWFMKAKEVGFPGTCIVLKIQ